MAVEKTVSIGGYTSQAYQMNGDKGIGKEADTEIKATTNVLEGSNYNRNERISISTDAKKIEPKEVEEPKNYEVDQQALHEKIQKSLDNYSSRMGNFEAKFGVHEETNRVTIKLVDKDTHEVLKEIPPEKTLDMIAKCLEIAGVLVDEKI